MSFHDEFIVPPYLVAADCESILGLVVLIGLLTFFYFAFGRLYQPGGGKHMHGKLGYNYAAAA